MTYKRSSAKKENESGHKVTREKSTEEAFIARCDRAQMELIEIYPAYSKPITEHFNALRNFDPKGTIDPLIEIIEQAERLSKSGLSSMSLADDFAKSITADLNKVRKEGYTSLRDIADRFNELGVKSARGGRWSHTTVKNMLQRRKLLGLD